MEGSSSTTRIFSRAMRLLPGLRRQLDRERRALARLRRDADAAAVRLDNVLHHRQPEAGALDRAVERVLRPVELVEDALLIGRRDAGPVVRDGHEDGGP